MCTFIIFIYKVPLLSDMLVSQLYAWERKPKTFLKLSKKVRGNYITLLKAFMFMFHAYIFQYLVINFKKSEFSPSTWKQYLINLIANKNKSLIFTFYCKGLGGKMKHTLAVLVSASRMVPWKTRAWFCNAYTTTLRRIIHWRIIHWPRRFYRRK